MTEKSFYLLPITYYLLPITNYLLPITHYQFMNVVVSYDISEDKRRTKIHSILKLFR
ncbi:CRISPR-associated endonuclease Cas2 [Dolichospermum sp. LEGE 00246]|uniref:CRISPR-associated endonuclease Cas2 n=1 Tax=Dolichospermum sp. LEGE 00246 TaxID=1828605 RepID=UPI001880359E|nr:CRISPR-associated endonuclease Cas2 [Dolichospermum sp. LEGE 00246]MBE9256158.1 CRISPR-associated endonuclease Cas2 [Dolichospermum sp. LEGE 00246]